MKNNFVQVESVLTKSFGKNIELLSSVDELFEIEMAYLEYNCLTKKELLDRSAFIKKIDNKHTNHYLLYSNYNEAINENRTAQTQAYFEEGQFSTGYATHGLFPYRGKFHPQLIKGLLNILGVRKGETVLDPMAGSGTANIEASLMGIHSYACDVSPFCQFMIQVKYESLTIDADVLRETNLNHKKLFDLYKQGNVLSRIARTKDVEKKKIYHLAFLAWLDALGYSKRVVRSNHEQLFAKVLPRYIETVKSTLDNPYFDKNTIGNVKVLSNSEALNIDLAEESMDCVITSPPYSFAIDYVENDKDQLEFLGYNTKELKTKLIGLKGKNKVDRLTNYFSDMDKVCNEISRLLKRDRYFCMIIGSNTNQTGGIRLEQTIIESARKYGLPLVKSIVKPI
ncbi:MAG: hypothetical protein LBG61_06270, partial [Burkholderiales bacterium]|nr:hypothetical protein [Burkholderiales bacterium]